MIYFFNGPAIHSPPVLVVVVGVVLSTHKVMAGGSTTGQALAVMVGLGLG
jgi:hypothetical protein